MKELLRDRMKQFYEPDVHWFASTVSSKGLTYRITVVNNGQNAVWNRVYLEIC